MIDFNKVTLTLVCLFLFSSPAAALNIDVMIVFAKDSGLSVVEKGRLGFRYQRELAEVYGDPIVGVTGQLDGLKGVTVSPLLWPEMSLRAKGKSKSEILDWMVSQNSNTFSPLRLARELLGNPGADVVIMVVKNPTPFTCGAVQAIPRVATRLNSESNAFAFVVLDDICREEFAVPHEFGHLLYSEHERDTNGDTLLPSYNNHATASSNTAFGVNLKSVMWHRITSEATNFLSGSLGTMTTGWADNVEFMSDESFAVVASYRALLPPPPRERYQVYWQRNCIGPSAEYLSLDVALSNGGVSYHVASSTTSSSELLCWLIAVIGGE
jgi:hypothetical protein